MQLLSRLGTPMRLAGAAQWAPLPHPRPQADGSCRAPPSQSDSEPGRRANRRRRHYSGPSLFVGGAAQRRSVRQAFVRNAARKFELGQTEAEVTAAANCGSFTAL